MNWFWWAFLTACIWGVVPLLEKTGLSHVDAIVGLFYRCTGVILGFVLLSTVMLRPQQIKSVDIRSAAWLILGGFLASFVGQLAFYQALKTGEISRVVPVSGSYPLIAFLLGVLCIGETMTPVKGAGIVLVVLGIWILKIG